MATVCSATLSLLNAGVPIKKSVAGIAMGLVKEGDNFVVLSDILGEEDHFGEMDFKVAGTQRGVTAVQLDLKGRGLPQDVIAETFVLAKEARLSILKDMLATLNAPRETTSKFAPRILTVKINPEKIGKVIGPGGKFIKSIEAETGATVEIDNDGPVTIILDTDDL